MESFMTAREAEREAMAIIEKYGHDQEESHRAMDELMLKILRQHGYEALCKLIEFEEMHKWYA